MNLQIGQIFERENKELCLLDFVDYENQKYALFSIEDKDANSKNKLYYNFYKIEQLSGGYKLYVVDDDSLNNYLLSICEERIDIGE